MPNKAPSVPANKGKISGQKHPFTQQHVRQIKAILLDDARRGSRRALRDLALFSVALDTMLRGCDVLRLTVADVTNHTGGVCSEFMVRQQKTGKGVLVALSRESRATMQQWINETEKGRDEYLFVSIRKRSEGPLTTAQYRRLVKYWAGLAHADPHYYSGHSTRRTKAALVYAKTRDIEVVRELLGQVSTVATSRYLNIGGQRALKIAQQIKL